MDESFYSLTPQVILETVEKAGFITTGRCFPLNSYENRVYEVEVEEAVYQGKPLPAVVAKFYRPLRWSAAQIEEEHAFIRELSVEEVPVIPPLWTGTHQNLFVAIYPRKRGRILEDRSPELLGRLGRFVGRMHMVGKQHPFQHRLIFTPEKYLQPTLGFLKNFQIPSESREKYLSAANRAYDWICTKIGEDVQKKTGMPFHRIHGDNHAGNWLIRDGEVLLVDFDDSVMGPAIQDLWLLLPDLNDIESKNALIEGYRQFCDLPHEALSWIEPLRALRMIHYTGWVARRWDDPAFPKTFPHFLSARYWTDEADVLNSMSVGE